MMLKEEQSKGLHVAIIMDGNGRWAAGRGWPRVAGHRAGADAVRRVVERALELGIRTLTLYAFSSDNWRRPEAEVRSIFRLLRVFLRLEAGKLKKRDVRLEVIGRRDRLEPRVLHEIERAECITRTRQSLHLRIAIDYSARDAIARAAASACFRFLPQYGSSIDLMRSVLLDRLTEGSADVDLLIRTGGEKRLSDFLLWECAYAELAFTERMWPDFCEADLDAALTDFKRRQRRFGGLSGSMQIGPTPGDVPYAERWLH